jgi:hypothetical protein
MKIQFAIMAATIATPAFADHVRGHPNERVPGFERTFENRGQCVSALGQVRNERWKSAHPLGWAYEVIPDAEPSQRTETTECRQNDDGSWYVFGRS